MAITDAVVAQLVQWWCRSGAEVERPLLSDDFEWDSGLETIGRSDFLSAWQYMGRIEGMRFVDLWVASDRATVMFEGNDAVTGLTHRFCWMASYEGDHLRRLRTCVGQVPGRERAGSETPT